MSEDSRIVNFDKREWLDPFRFLDEDSLRRVEIGSPLPVPMIMDLGTPVALQLLLEDGASGMDMKGRWAGDHVAVVGAYYVSPELDGDRLGEECHRGHYRELSSFLVPLVRGIVGQGGLDYAPGAMFLNLDKAEGLAAARDSNQTADSRLFDLLALPGSWRSHRPPYVGRWARDRVVYHARSASTVAFREIGFLFHASGAG